ncbi:MAG: GH1 family beta-glucosidase [Microbacteriaceae bacterium]
MSALESGQAANARALGARLAAGFVLGVASSAYQIEGGVDEGGRGSSSWDAFAHTRGRIRDGSTGDTAADSYHRYRQDIELMQELGVAASRFSIAWARILPEGTLAGGVNSRGIAYYDRLVDSLLEAGIDPVATLFHWDTPLPLERAGGWLNRETAKHFGDYSQIMADAIGDRVAMWVTMNEPATVTLNGYALGLHAPGKALLFDALPTVHHQLLAHGLAVRALRETGVAGQIGITNVHSPSLPASSSDADVAMAELFDLIHNRIFADPVLLGRYPDTPEVIADGLGDILSPLHATPAGDLEVIGAPLDFYGLNYYFPSVVRAGASASGASPDGQAPAMRSLPFSFATLPDHETTGFGWPIAPEFLGTVLRDLRKRYGDALPPIYITEGGVSFPDPAPARGRVEDRRRIDYLAAHLDAAATAIADGVDLRGYFVWSLLDNFEWAAGFTQRFGLVHVDFHDFTRTPKDSFRWFAELTRAVPPADTP